MRLYLVRHARPEIADGMCYGSSDVHAVEEEQQALLARLVTELPSRAPLFTSPLQRCRKLADKLAVALDAGPVTIDPRLAEMHFGDWEMRPWETIPRAEIDAWAADLQLYRPGGGEQVLEVAQRVHAFHAELLAAQHESAIVVCHAGTIRLLLARLHASSPAGMAALAAQAPHRIGYGEVITLDCQSDNNARNT